jgi:hypothetical protein
MSSSLVLSVTSQESSTENQSSVIKSTTAPHEQMKALKRLFKDFASGIKAGSVKLSYAAAAPVQASGTITVASVQADDTVTIGKTTLTGKASPANENQFDSDGTDAAVAAAIVAKINAHSVLSKLVYASAADDVVTVAAHQPGSIGNHVALASSGATLTVTGSGYLASGAGGAESAPVSYSVS